MSIPSSRANFRPLAPITQQGVRHNDEFAHDRGEGNFGGFSSLDELIVFCLEGGIIGAALAAIAGVLIAPLTAVVAQMGANYLARSFFVVIVGGAGSVPGVVAGSAFVGGAETFLNYVIPATFSQALVLVLAVIIVRLRPNGLVQG